MSDAQPPGRLLLVPNTLDHGSEPQPIDAVVAHGVLQQAAALAHWVVEDARSARAFLKRVAEHVPLALPLQQIGISELPRPRKGSREGIAAAQWTALLQPARHGHDLGLLSEAGLPAVADPGSALVAAAHAEGLPVLPLAGASALLLALAASGLNGQSFAFVGYLPQEAAARQARLKELQLLSRRHVQTQLMIETPYRNAALLDALLQTLAGDTRLAVSCGLSLPDTWNRSGTVADWRRRPVQMPDRVPAVFAFLAG